MSLRITPITLAEANAFVEAHHRHNAPTVGHLFSVAVSDEEVRGVAIVGRPVARMLQDGFTVEVLRCCTDGARNACSMLYGAAWRAARAMGYRRLVTYTLASEPGTACVAAGLRVVGQVSGGGTWHRESRPRVDTTPRQGKLRWEVSVPLVERRP